MSCKMACTYVQIVLYTCKQIPKGAWFIGQRGDTFSIMHKHDAPESG